MNDIDVAEGKMRIVKERMLGKYPLHGAIIARSALRPDGVGTMAVTIREGQLTFLFDPAFVIAQPLDVLVGGLLHEVGHVVFDHLIADPDKFRDREARTIAEEVTTNEFVGEPLPEGVLRIDAYGLPPDEDTDTRYGRLASQKTATKKPKMGTTPTKNGTRPKKNETVSRKNQGASAKNQTTGAEISEPQGEQSPATFDDHSAWTEIKDRTAGQEIIDVILAAAAAGVFDDAWRHVDARIRHRVNAAQQRVARVDEIASGTARINWSRVLAPITARRVVVTADFRRPSRRFPALIGIVPSYRREPGVLEVLTVIDTSGSISASDLASISAEIATIATKHRVTVAQCDDAIRSVARYEGAITRAHGRGGTSFRPPLDPAFLASHRADVVVYFTDGVGPAPAQPPRVPVFWILPTDATPPARWGRVVRRRYGR